MRKCYNGPILLAADLMMGKCTVDHFENFRYWLISRGETVFSKAIMDPDSLVEQLQAGKVNYTFPLFANVAGDALTNHTDKKARKILDNRSKVLMPEIDLSWREDIHKAMEKCPRLVANRLNNLYYTQIFQHTERNKNKQQSRQKREKK